MLCIRPGGAHTAFYAIGIGSFPGVEAVGEWLWPTNPIKRWG